MTIPATAIKREGVAISQDGALYVQIEPGSQVQADAGTNAAPGVTFSNDTDTGLYRSAANQIGVTLGGATEYLLDAASLAPATTNVNDLGTSSLIWKDIYAARALFADGTAAAPSISFASDADSGIFKSIDNRVSFSAGTVAGWMYNTAQIQLLSTYLFGWSSGAIGAANDVVLARDAAGVLAQRNSTSSQARTHYDTYTSATDYHRSAWRTARATLSGVTGASVTATGVIPDGAFVLGVTTKVTTGLGVTGGTTGYNVGDGSDVDRWGAIVGTAAGTSSDNTNATAAFSGAFTAANDVVITAVGGNFDGTGVIYVAVHYLIAECD